MKSTTRVIFVVSLWTTLPSLVEPFAAPSLLSQSSVSMARSVVLSSSSNMHDMNFIPRRGSLVQQTFLSSNTNKPNEARSRHQITKTISAAALGLWVLTIMPSKAEAIAGIQNILLPSTLAWYAHILSIITIAGCLAAERVLIKTDMTLEEEQTFNQIDIFYGAMVALLIGCGLSKAFHGGDFLVHEALFWLKMGVWGGLSVLPAIEFRDLREHDHITPQLEDKPVSSWQGGINAEIAAIASAPLLAILMSHEIGNNPNLSWEMGALLSLAATTAFFLYCETERLLVHKQMRF